MNNIWISALTYASTLVLVTQGFILMYRTSRVPNFSIGVFLSVGAYAAFTIKAITGIPFYLGVIFSFLFGVIVSFILSISIIEPMIRSGRNPVQMSIITIAIGMVIENMVQVITTYFEDIYLGHRGHLHLKPYDFMLGGIPGGFLVSSLSVFSTFLIIRYVNKHTVFGLSSRAINENNDLAMIQGINPVRNRVKIWAIAGGMASIAGALMGTRFCYSIPAGNLMMPTIFAAALLGGMDNENGAVLGGLVVGSASIVLTTYGQAVIGVWVGEYRFMISLAFVVLVMLVSPNGLLGSDLTTQPTGWIYRMNLKRTLTILVVILCSISICSNLSERNRIKARDDLFEGFSEYNLTTREIPKGTSSSVGNLTLFKTRIAEYNISTVYVEPFTDGATHFTFYYERNHVWWTTRVNLQLTWFFQYKIE